MVSCILLDVFICLFFSPALHSCYFNPLPLALQSSSGSPSRDHIQFNSGPLEFSSTSWPASAARVSEFCSKCHSALWQWESETICHSCIHLTQRWLQNSRSPELFHGHRIAHWLWNFFIGREQSIRHMTFQVANLCVSGSGLTLHASTFVVCEMNISEFWCLIKTLESQHVSTSPFIPFPILFWEDINRRPPFWIPLAPKYIAVNHLPHCMSWESTVI